VAIRTGSAASGKDFFVNPNPSSSLDEISEILPIAMLKFDSRGRIVSMNRAAHDLLASINISPEAVSTILTHRQRALLRHTLREKSDTESDWVQNGHNLHLIFKCSRDGSSAYLFLIDLTAQERAKAQLIQSEKMASLGLLIAGLAHEINTPLGAIHSNNDTLLKSLEKIREILEDRGNSGSRVQTQSAVRLADIMWEVCRNMSLATERLITIVGSLKNFARSDEADLRKADIHEGLDSTLTIVQHQFKNRIQVVKHYGDIPLVECHPNRLNQVFMNLLVNAGQAIPDRGTITITTSCEDGFVRIAVSDTGMGIPEGNLPKVFDPGFTTKGVGVGTGLGLSICYRIIEQHQGRIEVESSNQGSTFTVVLPIRWSTERTVKRGGKKVSSDSTRR
jgi:signal transduction histidine kinase